MRHGLHSVFEQNRAQLLRYLRAHGAAESGVLARVRERFAGPLMANGGFTATTANAAIRSGRADLISFGAPFISNPDLVERIRTGAPLAEGKPALYYGGGSEGYIDYPPLQSTTVAA
jgi:N-ethylmaleimide reductase